MSVTSRILCRTTSASEAAAVRPLSASALPRRAPALPGRQHAHGPHARPQTMTTLPEAHPRNLPDVWFNASFPLYSLGGGPTPNKPPDERTVKLGKTLRILQERLPSLLQTPLPSEILSPNISLHLFPSTHPHLPVVSGRVAYIAALWTSPLAWNRVPVVGNVHLEILSERMIRQPAHHHHAAPHRMGAGDEQLVVRWRTVGKGFSFGGAADPTKEFTGLFIFEFDSEGRILSHTIETVEDSGGWESSVGARFVKLTDWLLGGIRGGGSPPLPACEMADPRKVR